MTDYSKTIQINKEIFKSNLNTQYNFLKSIKDSKPVTEDDLFIDIKWLGLRINSLNPFFKFETIDKLNLKPLYLEKFKCKAKDGDSFGISKEDYEFLNRHYITEVPELEKKIKEEFQEFKKISKSERAKPSKNKKLKIEIKLAITDSNSNSNQEILIGESENSDKIILDLLKQYYQSILFIKNWTNKIVSVKRALQLNTVYYLIANNWIDHLLKSLDEIVLLNVKQNDNIMKCYETTIRDGQNYKKFVETCKDSKDFIILTKEELGAFESQFPALKSNTTTRKAKPLKSTNPKELYICIKPINLSIVAFPGNKKFQIEAFQNDTLSELLKQLREKKISTKNSILIQNINLKPRIIEESQRTLFEEYLKDDFSIILINYDNSLNETFGQLGIQNLRNTCYMNSGLQCLTHLPQVALYFCKFDHNHINLGSKFGLDGDLTRSFSEIIKYLWSDKLIAFSPRVYKKNIGRCNNDFASNTQEDAYQQIATAIDNMLEELKVEGSCTPDNFRPVYKDSPLGKEELETWCENFNKKYSFFGQTFLGQMRYKSQCSNCNYNQSKYQLYCTFPLIVPSETDFAKVILFRLLNNSGNQQHSPQECKVFYVKTGLVGEVKQKMILEHNLDPDKVVMYISEDNKLLRMADDTVPVIQSDVYYLYETEGGLHQSHTVITNLTYLTQQHKIDKVSKHFFPLILPLENKFSLHYALTIMEKYGIMHIDNNINIIEHVHVEYYDDKGLCHFNQPDNLKKIELVWETAIANKYLKDKYRGIDNRIWTLYESIKLHIEDVAYNTCQQCRANSCNKKIDICRLPEILIFQLKRLEQTGNDLNKVTTEVDFNETITLDKYVAGNQTNMEYQLWGVCNHSGTVCGGHYYSYAKHMFSKKWHCYDDAHVSSVSGFEEVKKDKSLAYMLFYVSTSSLDELKLINYIL